MPFSAIRTRRFPAPLAPSLTPNSDPKPKVDADDWRSAKLTAERSPSWPYNDIASAPDASAEYWASSPNSLDVPTPRKSPDDEEEGENSDAGFMCDLPNGSAGENDESKLEPDSDPAHIASEDEARDWSSSFAEYDSAGDEDRDDADEDGKMRTRIFPFSEGDASNETSSAPDSRSTNSNLRVFEGEVVGTLP